MFIHGNSSLQLQDIYLMVRQSKFNSCLIAGQTQTTYNTGMFAKASTTETVTGCLTDQKKKVNKI